MNKVNAQRNFWNRVRARVWRDYVKLRDPLEWRASNALMGRAPWCTNRLNQRYQPLSLAEYRYMRDGNPELAESLFAEQSLCPGATVIDVGANHGLFSLEAANFVGATGRVDAFEPTPRTREALRQHLTLNGVTNVRIFPQAVGRAEGVAKLRVHHEATGLNTLAEKDIKWAGATLAADELIDVPVVTLDQHARSQSLGQIDLLKVDVEGFELSVLEGARELLSERRIRRVLVEIASSTCNNANLTAAATVDELARHQYVLRAINPDGSPGARVDRRDSFPGANYIALAPGVT